MVQAARELLLSGGLPGLSMRKVASALGLSPTAIYRHYADKDALVAAAVLEGFRTFGAYQAEALQKSDPVLRLRHLGQRYFDFALQHPQDYRLIFMTDTRQQCLLQLEERSKKEIGRTFDVVQDTISEGQRAGAYRSGEPRTLAAYVWASVHGLASLIVNGQLGETPSEAQFLIEQQLDLNERALRS